MVRVEFNTEFLWGNPREKEHLEDADLYGRAILSGSSGIGVWGYGLDRAGSG